VFNEAVPKNGDDLVVLSLETRKPQDLANGWPIESALNPVHLAFVLVFEPSQPPLTESGLL
jgi:hypothetical protein